MFSANYWIKFHERATLDLSLTFHANGIIDAWKLTKNLQQQGKKWNARVLWYLWFLMPVRIFLSKWNASSHKKKKVYEFSHLLNNDFKLTSLTIQTTIVYTLMSRTRMQQPFANSIYLKNLKMWLNTREEFHLINRFIRSISHMLKLIFIEFQI